MTGKRITPRTAVTYLLVLGFLIPGATVGAAAETTPGTITFERWTPEGRADLYAAAADGSGERRLTAGAADEMTPAWSPDRTRLAYVGVRGDLEIQNLNGEIVTRVKSRHTHFWWPTWSPDGDKLAFHQWDPVKSRARLVTVNSDGSGLSPLTTGKLGLDFTPAWSPDGKWIAFVRYPFGDGASARHLHLITPDGSRSKQLTHGSLEALRPAWSPDGTRLAFMAWWKDSVEGNVAFYDTDIWVLPLGKAKPEKVTSGREFDAYPCWSTDGQRIGFTRSLGTVEVCGTSACPVFSTAPGDLFVVDADGSDIGQITNTPGYAEHSCNWTSDLKFPS